MKRKLNLESAYMPSDDVVARELEGELVIVPITSGIGDLEDEIFSLNNYGLAIWSKLDGKKSLKDVIDNLTLEFNGSLEQIEKDVLGLMDELLKRKMIVKV